jgi:L-ascorbate metabolism protein UlaG (beta-lactamase superfamily)
MRFKPAWALATVVWSCAHNAPATATSTSDACRSLVPAALGGAVPPPPVVALRWLGTANYELAYGDQVFLLDTFYDRGPRFRPIGFGVDQVRRADAILIGHAHWDHISDVAAVARQTRAPVIGAPVTIETALKLGVPAAQTRVVKSGDVLPFKGFTVEAILAQHSTLAPEVVGAFRTAIDIAAGKPTEEQAKGEQEVLARGSTDPRVIKEGTIAFLFTFDNGFRLIWRNSAGPITDSERAVMQRIGGKTDLAIVAYMGQYVASRQLAATMPIVELYNPRIFLPAHHDEIPGLFPDIGIEPLLMAVRDKGARAYSPLYREPICIDTSDRR